MPVFLGRDFDSFGTLIASYPANGMRFTWQQTEGLTGIQVGDDFRLGDDIVHDNVDHGAGGECEGVRQDGDDERDEGGAEHARHRLHQPGQLPVPGDGRRQQSVDSGLVS